MDLIGMLRRFRSRHRRYPLSWISSNRQVTALVLLSLCSILLFALSKASFGERDKHLNGNLAAGTRKNRLIRIGAAQPKARVIDWKLSPADALIRVEQSLTELEAIVEKAGRAGCDVVALPEDTLGLLNWEEGHKSELKQVLPEAVAHMLDRLGKTAAAYKMYLVCCNDTVDQHGGVRNTAFLLDRTGKEIGRYVKVNMPIFELDHKRGSGFPVFETPDLGGVGMLICYDMVFPEAARCLALGGADIVFNPTLGGASVVDGEVNLAAFRTRAAENFIYLVVAKRGGGAMIISPQGSILAEGKGPDDIAIAEIDPFGGREGGDSMNYQRDMRARLFRERSPAAFGMLSDPNPPVLKKAPETISIDAAVRIGAKTLTTGDARFAEADRLARQGKVKEAVEAFKKLQAEFPGTWVDREAKIRLDKLTGTRPNPLPLAGVHFAPNAEEGMVYGLTILPPWNDGGTLHASFPEHFEYGDVGYGITRYSDKRDNPWRIATDGRSASYDIESPELPGVRVVATATAEGDRALVTLKLINGGTKALPRIKPLLCFWYAKLAGFPGRLSDNFQFTHAVMDDRLVALSDVATANPQATAKVAYIRDCPQRDCDQFAKGRGGLIGRDVDRAMIAVTSRDRKRKALIAFSPGKSILSNAAIPCAHADPYFGSLEPGQSAEVKGVILFTEGPLDRAMKLLEKEGWGSLEKRASR